MILILILLILFHFIYIYDNNHIVNLIKLISTPFVFLKQYLIFRFIIVLMKSLNIVRLDILIFLGLFYNHNFFPFIY